MRQPLSGRNRNGRLSFGLILELSASKISIIRMILTTIRYVSTHAQLYITGDTTKRAAYDAIKARMREYERPAMSLAEWLPRFVVGLFVGVVWMIISFGWAYAKLGLQKLLPGLFINPGDSQR